MNVYWQAEKNMPIPHIGRKLCRALLRAWGRLEKADGYRYQIIDRYGAAFAEETGLPSRLPNGCQVECDLRDEVQRLMWFFGVYEPIESYLFTQLIKPGMVVIDAGSNVGQYTLLASTIVGDSGGVHSFEPIPKNFMQLQRHVTVNNLNNVCLNKAALWSEDKTLKLGMPNEIRDNAGAYSVRAPFASFEAPAYKLDTYVKQMHLSHVHFIKMDIEGAEPFALSGASQVLNEYHPTILLEVNRKTLEGAGSSTAQLWDQVKSLHYRAWRIGITPKDCGPVENFEQLVQCNVLLHQEDLPDEITNWIDCRNALRWARLSA